MPNKKTPTSFLRNILQRQLFILSKKVLEKYKPKIIAITGSVGKTSARQAIFTVLNFRFDCRQSEENYNNELGVPLTILGERSAGRSLLGWFDVFWKGQMLLMRHNPEYPKVLVLELGIDHPGDMEYLTQLVTPDIAVLTGIGISHLENFGSQEKLSKEKRRLIAAVPKDGHVLLNADNVLSRESAGATKANVLTYGFHEGASIQASDLMASHKLNQDDSEEVELAKHGFPLASSFKVQYKGNSVPFAARRVLGKHQVSPLLPAIGAGLILGMNLVEISEALRGYLPPRGRMNLIPGLKGSLIIDDTYNSAPDSAKAALEMLKILEVKGRKIAVLGDMLELGAATEAEHRAVGELAAGVVDELITFGPRSQFTADEARVSGLSDANIHHVAEDHRQVERLLQNKLRMGDVVLVKGSQSVRMEKVVVMLMADPAKAKKLLVRQSLRWEKKKFEMPGM